MAYDKKYIGEKEVIKTYLDNREDRIESEFNVVTPEFGSNTNGNYVKFPDGTLICWNNEYREDVAMTVPMGALYREDKAYTWYFPHNFIGYPSVDVEPLTGLGNGKYISGISHDYLTYRNTSTESVTRSVRMSYMAIGRWK